MTELRHERNLTARSVVDEAWIEAHKHKWIESQKRGYDVGDAALRDWFHQHWPLFCRRKYVQHLHGDTFWREFSDDKFGVLNQIPIEDRKVFDTVLGHVYNGMENLCILNFALQTEYPLDMVRQLLGIIDMNNYRLQNPYSL